jgi:hypothetical protein
MDSNSSSKYVTSNFNDPKKRMLVKMFPPNFFAQLILGPRRPHFFETREIEIEERKRERERGDN